MRGEAAIDGSVPVGRHPVQQSQGDLTPILFFPSNSIQTWDTRTRVSRTEMEEVAAKTDIAFTTNFWTSPIVESFMTMSMHWITQDWRLKTHIMGTIYFPQQHTTANISDKLMDLRLNFGVYPKSRDGRPPQSL